MIVRLTSWRPTISRPSQAVGIPSARSRELIHSPIRAARLRVRSHHGHNAHIAERHSAGSDRFSLLRDVLGRAGTAAVAGDRNRAIAVWRRLLFARRRRRWAASTLRGLRVSLGPAAPIGDRRRYALAARPLRSLRAALPWSVIERANLDDIRRQRATAGDGLRLSPLAREQSVGRVGAYLGPC